MEIDIKDIWFSYDQNRDVLRNINVQISQGEKIAIMGENGAGKTTLVKHLNGILKPKKGSIMIGDVDTVSSRVSLLSRYVGFAFQNPDSQLFEKSVWAELIFGPRNIGMDKKKSQSIAMEILDLLELRDKKNLHPHDLGLPQRKLLSIGSVLTMDTPIVVLDEPTLGQDYQGKQIIARVIKWLEKKGKTIISISHDIDFCCGHFDRFLIMTAGEIVFDGKKENVLHQEALLTKAHLSLPHLTRLGNALHFDQPIADLQAFLVNLAISRSKKSLT